jgi:hypothetical protein
MGYKVSGSESSRCFREAGLQRGGVLSRPEAPGDDTWKQRLGDMQAEHAASRTGFKLLGRSWGDFCWAGWAPAKRSIYFTGETFISLKNSFYLSGANPYFLP